MKCALSEVVVFILPIALPFRIYLMHNKKAKKRESRNRIISLIYDRNQRRDLIIALISHFCIIFIIFFDASGGEVIECRCVWHFATE